MSVADRHFVVRVDGFSTAFVLAPNHSKARAKVAYSLMNANYAYDFFDAVCMIRSLRLTDEPIGSYYSSLHSFE